MLYRINHGIVKFNAETILEDINIEIKDGEKQEGSIRPIAKRLEWPDAITVLPKAEQ